MSQISVAQIALRPGNGRQPRKCVAAAVLLQPLQLCPAPMDCDGEIGQRRLIVAFHPEGDGAVVVSRLPVRPQADHLAEIRNGAVEIAVAASIQAALVVGRDQLRIERDRAVVVLDRLVEFLLLVERDAVVERRLRARAGRARSASASDRTPRPG